MDIGTGYRDLSRQMLSDVAARKEERKRYNDSIRQQKQASTLSATGSGAVVGATVGGPWGALIGGAVGFLSSSLLSGDVF